MDNRQLNSLSLAVLQAGIPCWDRDVKRYVDSANIPAYHPFTDYLERLPEWDGVDRVTPPRPTREPSAALGEILPPLDAGHDRPMDALR